MGRAASETVKGPEASEKNPRAPDPFNVRAIQDSNLWPLAPEGAPGKSIESKSVQAFEKTDGKGRGQGFRGLVGRSWTLPHGTLRGPTGPRGLRVAQPRPPELLTVRDVAQRLRVSTATVYALCERSALPHCRVSNAIRIRREDFDAFLSRGGSQ